MGLKYPPANSGRRNSPHWEPDLRDKRQIPRVLDPWRERGATTHGPHQARLVWHVDNESGHCAINEPEPGEGL